MSQKFLSPVKLSGISTGSILKVDSNGVIVAAVSNTDYATPGGVSQWTTTGNDIYYNTGNVGIGESSPDGILHIKGSSQATEFYIESSTGTASTSGAIKIAQNNRSAEDFAGEMVFYVQDNNVGGTYWREAMAIINSGNIAIGSTDPGNYRLKVTGSANITGAVTLSNYGAGFLKADANGLLSVDTSTYITGYTETDTLDSVTDRGATTTNTITVGGALISATAPLLDFVDTNSFTDVNDRFRIRAVGDAGRIQWYDSSASSTLDLMHFSLNGNVGIGTTSPSYALDIERTTGEVAIQLQARDNSSNTAIYFGDNDDADVGSLIYNQGSNYMSFTTNAGERMRITSDGNVGIGTTSPGAKLEVFGTGNTLRLDSAANGSKEILFRNVGTGTATIKTDGDLKLYVEDAGKNILFDTTGGEKMRITAGGNVGIGTTSPTSKLQVNGQFRQVYSRAFIANPLDTDGYAGHIIVNSNNANGDLAGIGLYTNSSYNAAAGLFALQESSSAASMVFYTGSNFGAEKMRITSGGNVGINTTSPEDKLHVVVTSTSAAQGIYLDSGNGSAGSAYLNVSTTNGPVLTGNTTPAGLARGAYKASRMQFNSLGFKFEHSAEETANAARTWSTHMVINTSGDVGIGTTSPSTKLHVDGTVTALGIKTENLATVIDNSGIQPAQGEVEDIVLFKHSGTEVASIDTGGYLTATGYKTGGTTGFLKSDGTVDTNAYISSSTLYSTVAFTINGNDVEIGDEVSIGSGLSFDSNTYTISSSDTLDSVTDRGATTTNNITVGSLKSQGDVGVTQADGDFLVKLYQSSADGFIQLYTGETAPVSRVKISSYGDSYINPAASGGLGVGTTSPTAKFHINAANGDGLKITTADVATIKMGSTTGGTSYWGFATTNLAASDFGIYQSNSVGGDPITAGTPRLYFKSDGNVGIGTTSPSAKLDVNGSFSLLGGYDGYWLKGVQGNSAPNGNSPFLALVNNNTISSATYGWLFYDSNTDGSFNLYRRNNSTTGNQVLTISRSTGNVGIGTTSPTRRLHVVSSDDTRGIMVEQTLATSYAELHLKAAREFRVGTGGATSDAGAQNRFYVYDSTAGAHRFTIDSSGNVGIGTTSPSSKLHVYGGDIRLDNGSGDGYIKDSASNNRFYFGTGTYINSNTGGPVAFQVAGSEKMRVNYDGNVGIGTTSPGYKLEVSGNVGVSSSITSGSTTPLIFIGNGNGSTYTQTAIYANQNNTSGSNGNGIFIERGRLTDSASAEVRHFVIGARGGQLQWKVDGDGTTTQTGGAIISGNVGIGVTDPQAKLEVMGASNTPADGNEIISVTNTTGGTKLLLGVAENAYGWIQAAEGTTLRNLLLNPNGGNVGIGTTSPSYKLDVNGSFNCTSMNVTENISTSAGNVVVQNGAGIYSIKSTIGTSTSGTAFRIANTNDVQAARATFVAETTNYQVAKIYEVVHAGNGDPVAFKVVDTGPSGEEDFSVSFSNDGGDLLCTVTNDSANESLTLITTIFVGGSNTSQTVSNS